MEVETKLMFDPEREEIIKSKLTIEIKESSVFDVNINAEASVGEITPIDLSTIVNSDFGEATIVLETECAFDVIFQD